MTTKRQDVFEVLGNTAVYQVIPYGKQMVKLLGSDGEAAGVFGRGQNTFILSTDDETLYHKDATVLKPRGADGKASFGHYGDAGVFKRSDSELIEKEIRAAIQKDIQSRFKVGQEFDVVSNVLRRVPLNLSRIFFGIPTVDRGDEAARKGDNQGGAYDMNANFVTKYKAAMTRATREFNFSTVYPEPPAGSQDILAIRKFREAKDFYDNYLPQARAEFAANKAPIADDLDIYNWVKSTFRNLFNNVPREQYVMMKGEIDGIRLMSWVYSKVVELASDKAKINPNTMAGRLLAFLDLTVDKPAMASLERITENIFGTLVGAVVGQEEGMARTIDVLLKLGDVESSYYKGPGRYTPKSSEITTLSQAFFNEAIKIASEAPSPENTKRLGVMCFEAMRLEPQGETLIRQVVTENKMGEKLGRANESTQTKVKKNQVVFAAHGSAMDDYDTAPADLRGDVYNPNRVARNPDDAAEEKEMRDVYLTHGWGRHHCLGRYVSITMIIEAARAIMQIPGVRSVEQPKEQEHFGRPKMRLIMDQNNLYAEKLMVTGTAMPTFAG
jgi:cytochrome P450